MEIFAHRCYRDGPDATSENALAAFRDCLMRGHGVETDIRRSDDGGFYISHDKAQRGPENGAEAFFAELRRFEKPTVALNVKELGYEVELLGFLQAQDVLGKLFLFDMELLEPQPGETARRLRSLSADVKLAARVSDRGESVARALGMTWTSIIWLDEFDSLWVQGGDVRALQAAGRKIYAISPEIHGFSRQQMLHRWQKFQEWGIDGICTDYPDLLKETLLQDQGMS
jgi:glycerophosphoryl diester phosphodiesterase